MRVAAVLFTSLLLLGTLGAAPLSEVDRLTVDADLDFVLQHVSGLYYGRTSPQELLDGERAGLVAYLKSRGVAADLPVVRATDPAGVRAQAQAELAFALKRYGARVDAQMLGYAASKGVAASVNDPYTAFFTPAEYRSFNSVLAPVQFSGVGIIVQSDPATGFIVAFDVLPNGPADRNGVQQDDLLVRIGGHDTKSMAIKDASALLRGAQNT
ncbi:MAG: PDZ domain-containing protein, partial [Candidatus Eremiobacteraeota bacterium]|nr:PDZ domain-containing protein [Candidatus Eremiobacteraeota bacterium]